MVSSRGTYLGPLFTKGDYSEEEIMHDLWVERELRIAAVEPTFVSRDVCYPSGTSALIPNPYSC